MNTGRCGGAAGGDAGEQQPRGAGCGLCLLGGPGSLPPPPATLPHTGTPALTAILYHRVYAESQLCTLEENGVPRLYREFRTRKEPMHLSVTANMSYFVCC